MTDEQELLFETRAKQFIDEWSAFVRSLTEQKVVLPQALTDAFNAFKETVEAQD